MIDGQRPLKIGSDDGFAPRTATLFARSAPRSADRLLGDLKRSAIRGGASRLNELRGSAAATGRASVSLSTGPADGSCLHGHGSWPVDPSHRRRYPSSALCHPRPPRGQPSRVSRLRSRSRTPCLRRPHGHRRRPWTSSHCCISRLPTPSRNRPRRRDLHTHQAPPSQGSRRPHPGPRPLQISRNRCWRCGVQLWCRHRPTRPRRLIRPNRQRLQCSPRRSHRRPRPRRRRAPSRWIPLSRSACNVPGVSSTAGTARGNPACGAGLPRACAIDADGAGGARQGDIHASASVAVRAALSEPAPGLSTRLKTAPAVPPMATTKEPRWRNSSTARLRPVGGSRRRGHPGYRQHRLERRDAGAEPRRRSTRNPANGRHVLGEAACRRRRIAEDELAVEARPRRCRGENELGLERQSGAGEGAAAEEAEVGGVVGEEAFGDEGEAGEGLAEDLGPVGGQGEGEG